MAEASIPVDLFNPGQVFACLGFLEIADVLLGNAQGGFDWSDESEVRFHVAAKSSRNPLAEVLGFLASADVQEVEPIGWPEPLNLETHRSDCFPSPLAHHRDANGEVTRTKLPVRLLGAGGNQAVIPLESWSDASNRPEFKLYAGNRSGFSIARDMLRGKRSKPSKKNSAGQVLTCGVEQLWQHRRSELLGNPFDTVVSIGGSFNFDARSAWTPLDAGYSPDEQGHRLSASPAVEILASVGIEHSRPLELKDRVFQYAAWGTAVYPELARALMAGSPIGVSLRAFQFKIRLAGKNKIVSFAEEAFLE